MYKPIFEVIDRETLIDLVRERFNCQCADIEGYDVWVCGPQRGHWLSAEDLLGLEQWVSETYPEIYTLS